MRHQKTFLYMSLSYFSDDSHIISILRLHYAINQEQSQTPQLNPDGDETEEETVSIRCDALMCSDTHKQNMYNHSSERKK